MCIQEMFNPTVQLCLTNLHPNVFVTLPMQICLKYVHPKDFIPTVQVCLINVHQNVFVTLQCKFISQL